jgi:glycosyltransferase involved in cell wall biosynthesis
MPHYRRRLFELLCGADDIQFTIASDNQSDSLDIKVVDPRDSPIRWVLCPTRAIGSRLFWHPELITFIRREKPDAVITLGNPYVLTAWVLLLWGWLTNMPVLFWTHGLLGPESGLKGFIRRTFYRLASALLLYGDHAKALLVDVGIDPRRMFVIYNSLDSETQQKYLNEIKLSDLEAFRSMIGVSGEDRIVVFSGRFQINKKLDSLLDAIGMLRERSRIVHIALIGDGPERPALVSQAVRLGIGSQVHFLGESYEERFIATVFMASDLSVIPSGAGLSVMHALGYGVPVLLHDRPEEHGPEWEAIREGKSGFFYRYGDIGDMADKIEGTLFPTSQKERMREACLAMIRNRYNAAAHAGAIISAVKQVVERRS